VGESDLGGAAGPRIPPEAIVRAETNTRKIEIALTDRCQMFAYRNHLDPIRDNDE